MIERVQEIQILAQHREKMISLGTLAAGLAHELNNPASAARRAARELRQIFPVLQTHTLRLSQQPMTDEHREYLTALQQDIIQRGQTALPLDPMVQSDREDQITEWMEAHHIPNGWQLASTLVNAGLDIDWLNQLSERLAPKCLPVVLIWLDATLTVVGLLQTLGHSTDRIHQLVEAVQDYSSLDPEEGQAIDVHEGLENTLTLLQHKLKRDITVIRDYGSDLPVVLSRGHELEQVWMNLMDNAIDAVGECFNQAANPTSTVLPVRSLVIPTGWQGTMPQVRLDEQKPTIQIKTRCEANWVLVEIRDNGVGIPPEVQPRIFEPFFTTKGIGRGTGLGLNTSYKIIERHNGDIRVLSRPGDTCFQVRLPSHC
jgi:signal transduction histidine kinase